MNIFRRLCSPLCSCTWWRPWVSMEQLAPEKWQASLARIPSLPIHNQSVVHLEVQTCPPPSIAAFANGLSSRAMPGSRRLGKRFQWRRFLCFGIFHAWQHSTRCFLSDSRGTEWISARCEQVSPSSTVLPQDWIKLADVRLSEYSQGRYLSPSIGIWNCVASCEEF